MRAGLRWKTVLLAGGLWLVPASALAQEAPPATTNTPATDSIGPRELQNFSLPGTTTKPADQPPPQPAPVTSPPRPRADTAVDVSRPEPKVAQRRSAPASASSLTAASQAVTPPQATSTDSLPPATMPAPQPTPSAAIQPPAAAPAGALAPERPLSLLPWIAAALALAGGTIFLLWWRRPRQAYAGPEFDLFAASEPTPAPLPQAPQAAAPKPTPPVSVPPKPAPRGTGGIVASRLRPSIEIGMQPLRCMVEDEQVTIEFEVDLYNAGTAPARAVLAEASLLNASATHDQELAAFFANPVGAGERLAAIPPMKRVTLTSRVVAPRSAIQEYELAGRKTFVPVIAFNALYEWSGGKEQTSAAYLVGRETKGDKLGPLRLDLGPREFRGLDARPLPAGLRT
jgi:hypothetical protein